MKILVFGAGVIGSIYAAKLHDAGFNVTLLARSKRYEVLVKKGVILKDMLTGKQTVSMVQLTQKLEAGDFYDLIIIAVRLNQIESVVPVLKNNNASPLVMFMQNNPDMTKIFVKELKQKQIILGFPGVGGIYKNDLIEYIQIKQQETMIGGHNGGNSARIQEIKTFLEKAGFKVSISMNMEAWLKVHAVFIACVSAAISKENGNSLLLGKKRSSVKIMVKGIREGFRACKALGMPLAPTNLKIIFMIMPLWFSVSYWQKAIKGKVGTLAIAPHVNKATDEMQLLAEEVLAIVHLSSVPTPTLDMLLSTFINSK